MILKESGDNEGRTQQILQRLQLSAKIGCKLLVFVLDPTEF
jgi:hypothetical protein